jgi:hypothetical protein
VPDAVRDFPLPFDELVSFFAEDLQDRVVGVTPLFRQVHGPDWMDSAAGLESAKHEREAEIRLWLQTSMAPRAAWAALDDMPMLFTPGCTELVVCDPKV